VSKLISVVLPVYNQAEYLPSALDSVLAQDYRPFELVVVNDGSTDGTGDVLEEYRRRHDFRLISQENQGLPRALNRGFAEAQGDYLTWTSSDNIAKPGMLSTLAAALDRRPDVGLVYADWDVIDASGLVIARVRSIEHDRYTLFLHNYVNACFLYRRECRDTVGDYDDSLRGGEDWDYWLRLSRHYRMFHIPETLYQYREHAESLTANAERLVRERKLAGYRQFNATWRRREPHTWWVAKIRWNVYKRLLRDKPGIKRELIEKSEIHDIRLPG
jgi:O-antigen biosynthesis protein